MVLLLWSTVQLARLTKTLLLFRLLIAKKLTVYAVHSAAKCIGSLSLKLIFALILNAGINITPWLNCTRQVLINQIDYK